MIYALPPLAYNHNALEPSIDGRTMEIHHEKHHAGYVAKLNAALEGSGVENESLASLLRDLNRVPENVRTAVRNNGGGHYNHTLFWEILSPNGGAEPDSELANAINNQFGSFDAFKETFNQAATTRFGSGWAWLSVGTGGELKVHSTPNQDNPLMEGFTPILGLDVWEHAYYLNYQNRRPDYITAFWNIVNWEAVQEKFEALN